MRLGSRNVSTVRGNLLPRSPLAAGVEQRAAQVGDLILQRRKIAMAYRRSQSEEGRIALEQVDHDLARYNIDIPAIHRRMNRN
jgi:hypothetical protein